MIAKTHCVYTVHHCMKSESPSDVRCFIVIMAEMFPKIQPAVSYPLSAVRFVGLNV